eukprot:PhM_4_TR15913/c3_g1_i1/m.3423/K18422/MOV10; helicase MOV-10
MSSCIGDADIIGGHKVSIVPVKGGHTCFCSNRGFQSEEIFYQHVCDSHRELTNFASRWWCSCGKSFSGEEERERHMTANQHKPLRSLAMSSVVSPAHIKAICTCGRGFASVKALTKHMDDSGRGSAHSHYFSRPTCLDCQKDFDSLNLLAAHKKQGCSKKRRFTHESVGARAPQQRLRPNYLIKLNKYPVPLSLRNSVATCRAEAQDPHHKKIFEAECCKFLAAAAAKSSVKELLHAFLYVEDAQDMCDMHFYDIHEPKFTRTACGNLYRLPVEGLAEKRPAVLTGDEVVCTIGDKLHTGFVHDVERDAVLVNFNLKKCDVAKIHRVTFTVSRTTYRRQHRAIDHCPFTTSPAGALSPRKPPLQKSDLSPDLNEAQRNFIEQLLDDKRRLNICWGPPGTGKTWTIVHAIRQLCKCPAVTHILVAAPSNTAARQITERLVKNGTPTKDILHLHADSVLPQHLSKEVLDCSPEGLAFPMKAADVTSSRIIVATLSQCARLFGLKLPPGHFSDIVVDEAGQASVPELMQALTFADPSKTRLCLSGDHKQLGPIVRCAASKQRSNLYVSALEQYATDTSSNHGIVVQLTKNYRSHPDIVHVVNQFYDNKLVSTRPSTKTCAVEFHHVSGTEAQEKDSPSYKNEDEINIVVKLVNDMVRDGTHKSICVLTGYIKQRKLLQKALRSHANVVTVCTVEAFQGNEADAVVISCVRSHQEALVDADRDARHHLGFIKQKKRINVALSRARDKLVVVGNANTLRVDPEWRAIIKRVGVVMDTDGTLAAQ